MSATTFSNVSHEEFKQAAGSFFRATSDLSTTTIDSAEAGYKCLSLMYIGRAEDWDDRQEHEAQITLELANKRLAEVNLSCAA